MSTGYLIVETKTNFDAIPVGGAQVKIKNTGGETLYNLTSNQDGRTERVSLDTVDKKLSLDPNYKGEPYETYDLEIEAPGYETIIINGVHIFDGETAIQPVIMIPMLRNEVNPSQFTIDIGENAVEMTEERNQTGAAASAIGPENPRQRILQQVIIPNNITVHLGTPNSNAQNVSVPFTEYIKNTASHEIYPTWPESSIRANIYVIITFALNRIYTEWYRSRGYNFDITNSTAYDQYFVYGGTIYDSISKIVDEIFNQYVRRSGQYAPYFTSFCNGTTAKCDGLSQWGTVDLANSGMTPLQILRYYYPKDVEIVESNIFSGYIESYPGAPLRSGDKGLDVQTIQKYLNRIRKNYPIIPVIAKEDGVFGPDTAAAVQAFQRIFDLTANGTVDRGTWYKISYIYTAVANLAELESEGNSIGIGTVPPNVTLKQGSGGKDVINLQYMLNFISEFHPVVPKTAQNGSFGADTASAVKEFQRIMGLPQDGVVGSNTWNALYDTYWGIVNNTKPSIPSGVTEYTVQSGDSLYLLAQRFGTTVDDIKRLNGLIGDQITVGQKLKIPAKTPTPTPAPPPASPSFDYTVKSGDSLYFLAQRFGVSVDSIKNINGLTSDSLNIGQILKIPGGALTYTVKSGDTLYLLAQRFGTTVNSIISFNNLSSSALNIGQVLFIPQ